MNKEQLSCIKKLSNNKCLYTKLAFFVLSIWNWSIKRREKNNQIVSTRRMLVGTRENQKERLKTAISPIGHIIPLCR